MGWVAVHQVGGSGCFLRVGIRILKNFRWNIIVRPRELFRYFTATIYLCIEKRLLGHTVKWQLIIWSLFWTFRGLDPDLVDGRILIRIFLRSDPDFLEGRIRIRVNSTRIRNPAATTSRNPEDLQPLPQEEQRIQTKLRAWIDCFAGCVILWYTMYLTVPMRHKWKCNFLDKLIDK